MSKKKDSSKTKPDRKPMSYQKKIYRPMGSPGDNDVPDAVDLTEEEEFALYRDSGQPASRIADGNERQRYVAWLEKNPKTGKVKATKPTRKKKQGRDQKFRLKIGNGPNTENPSESELFRAVDALTPLGGPSFLALEAPGGHYAQAAGGDGMYAVECRDWLDDRFETFQHFVAGKQGEPGKDVRIPTNEFNTISVKENECLSAADVKIIMGSFLRGEGRHPA